MKFEDSFERLMAKEGRGRSAHKADRGGDTFAGISRRWYPKWLGWVLVDAGLDGTNAELWDAVRTFYRVEYWDRLRCDELPDAIADELFEQAVNIGTHQTIVHLQIGLNVLNRGGKVYPNLKADGRIGPATMAAVEALDTRDERVLYNAVNHLQAGYYIDIAQDDESQEDFIRGWLERAEHV